VGRDSGLGEGVDWAGRAKISDSVLDDLRFTTRGNSSSVLVHARRKVINNGGKPHHPVLPGTRDRKHPSNVTVLWVHLRPVSPYSTAGKKGYVGAENIGFKI